MSHSSFQARHMTPEEYLAWEETQQERHEYLNGTIRAMSGGSWSHNLIVANVTQAVGVHLSGKPCLRFTSSQRVQAKSERYYFYPDVGIVCGTPQFGFQEALLNPTALFEILSPSTERYDKGEKFALYREIESLTEYFLVYQETPKVEVYRRGVGGEWDTTTYTVYVGLGATLLVESIGIQIPLSEVYDGLDFPEPEEVAELPEEKAL